jgi:hypothetical protein
VALPKEQPENGTEINQLAKKALAKAGQKPAPSKLYWLQLVRWALSSGKLGGFNHHLLLFLELLEGSDPKAAMEFLEGKERDQRLKSVASENRNPIDLARLLLIHLDCCMTEKVEGYSRVHKESPPTISAFSNFSKPLRSLR